MKPVASVATLLVLVVVVALTLGTFSVEARKYRPRAEIDEDEFEGGDVDDTVHQASTGAKNVPPSSTAKREVPPSALNSKEGRVIKTAGLWGYFSTTIEVPPAEEIREAKSLLEYCLKYFSFELAGFSLLFLVLLNYFANGKMNKLVLDSFTRHNVRIWFSQFHRIDFGNSEKRGPTIVVDGHCEYKLYGSGRQNVQWALATVNLQERQNLFLYLSNFYWRERDVVTLEARLEDVMTPLAFFVAKDIGVELAEVKRQPIFKELATPRSKKNLEGGMTCLAESEELCEALFGDLQGTLKTASKWFLSLTICDLAASIESSDMARATQLKEGTSEPFVEGEPMLILRFLLPPIRNMNETTPLVHLFFFLMDKIGSLNLRQGTIRKHQSARQSLKDRRLKSAKAAAEKEKASTGTASEPVRQSKGKRKKADHRDDLLD